VAKALKGVPHQLCHFQGAGSNRSCEKCPL